MEALRDANDAGTALSSKLAVSNSSGSSSRERRPRRDASRAVACTTPRTDRTSRVLARACTSISTATSSRATSHRDDSTSARTFDVSSTAGTISATSTGTSGARSTSFLGVRRVARTRPHQSWVSACTTPPHRRSTEGTTREPTGVAARERFDSTPSPRAREEDVAQRTRPASSAGRGVLARFRGVGGGAVDLERDAKAPRAHRRTARVRPRRSLPTPPSPPHEAPAAPRLVRVRPTGCTSRAIITRWRLRMRTKNVGERSFSTEISPSRRRRARARTRTRTPTEARTGTGGAASGYGPQRRPCARCSRTRGEDRTRTLGRARARTLRAHRARRRRRRRHPPTGRPRTTSSRLARRGGKNRPHRDSPR